MHAPTSNGQHSDPTAQRFHRARAFLQQAIAERAFPGASVAVTLGQELLWSDAVGRFTYDSSSPAVALDTVFDLASVSKVAATTAMAMVLHERGKLSLDQPIADIVPEFAEQDVRKRAVTFAHLLTHTSGLPGYLKLFETCHSPAELLASLFRVELLSPPGSHAEYSDLGFILLGRALEKLTGEPLDDFCSREIFNPLAMTHTFFRPSLAMRLHMPPTELRLYSRDYPIQGEVHDENAYAMGGVAGHAGLFGSAPDLARFALCLLRGGAPLLRRETIERFTRKAPGAIGSHALGWDTPTPPSQSGKYFSPGSFGHLGFTGTSLWCDPVRQVSITLLTNRTWPDRSSNAIKQVRPAVHDAIIEALES